MPVNRVQKTSSRPQDHSSSEAGKSNLLCTCPLNVSPSSGPPGSNSGRPVGLFISGGFVSISTVTYTHTHHQQSPNHNPHTQISRKREGNANRFIQTTVIHTYRTIIHQPDIHHSLKDAVFDSIFAVELADFGDESVVEFFPFGCRGGFVEVGFVAFFGCC